MEEVSMTLPPLATEALMSSGCASWQRWKHDSRLVAMIWEYVLRRVLRRRLDDQQRRVVHLYGPTYFAVKLRLINGIPGAGGDAWFHLQLTMISSLPSKVAFTVSMSFSRSARTATSQTETVMLSPF
jgi:hypothetical protein